MTAVLIFLSVLVPSGVLGLWASANLQCCHMGFVTGSLLLGRFSLFWILLWVSYFCSVLPGQTEPRPYMAVSPSRAPGCKGMKGYSLQGQLEVKAICTAKDAARSGCPPGKGSGVTLNTFHWIMSTQTLSFLPVD